MHKPSFSSSPQRVGIKKIQNGMFEYKKFHFNKSGESVRRLTIEIIGTNFVIDKWLY